MWMDFTWEMKRGDGTIGQFEGRALVDDYEITEIQFINLDVPWKDRETTKNGYITITGELEQEVKQDLFADTDYRLRIYEISDRQNSRYCY